MYSRRWLIAVLAVWGLAAGCSQFNTNLTIQTSSSSLDVCEPWLGDRRRTGVYAHRQRQRFRHWRNRLVEWNSARNHDCERRPTDGDRSRRQYRYRGDGTGGRPDPRLGRFRSFGHNRYHNDRSVGRCPLHGQSCARAVANNCVHLGVLNFNASDAVLPAERYYADRERHKFYERRDDGELEWYAARNNVRQHNTGHSFDPAHGYGISWHCIGFHLHCNGTLELSGLYHDDPEFQSSGANHHVAPHDFRSRGHSDIHTRRNGWLVRALFGRAVEWQLQGNRFR